MEDKTLQDELLAGASADLLTGYSNAKDERSLDKWLAAMFRVRAKRDPAWAASVILRYPRECIRLGATIGTIVWPGGQFPIAGESWHDAIEGWCHFEHVLGGEMSSEAEEIAVGYGRRIIEANIAQRKREDKKSLKQQDTTIVAAAATPAAIGLFGAQV
jgi:hypothetical protein